MPDLIMTKGLPASGKSTWAKKHVQDRTNWIRISNDEMRVCFFNRLFSKGDTDAINKLRMNLVRFAMDQKLNIVVDNVNLHPKHEQQLRTLCGENNYKFKIQSFCDVPLAECLRRNKLRTGSVPAAVVIGMYNQFIKDAEAPAVEAVEVPVQRRERAPVADQDESLPHAIICDLDGTLALIEHRNPYDASNCNEDDVNPPVCKTIHAMRADGCQLILVSGRKDQYEAPTRQFLREKCGLNDSDYILYMRKTEDNRKDSIVKKEIYENNIQGKWYIHFILDDRNQVVDFWRSVGLTCYQVANGDF
jgi:predicted kinase